MTHVSYAYFQDKIIPFDQIHIRPDDLGIIRGFGIFDFFRTYNGKPVTLKENLARFQNSAKIIGLSIPYSEAKITQIIRELLDKNAYPESTVRLVLTGGVTQDMFSPGEPTFYILVQPSNPLPQELYTHGAKLMTFEHLRLFAEAKTLNYMQAVQLIPRRQKSGALEILYTFKGNILECSTSNFFMFKGDTLITSDRDILKGVTRKILLELAPRHFKIELREVRVEEIAEASEIFITATNKQVVPIVSVDTVTVGAGKVGANTKKIHELFLTEMKRRA